MFEYSMIKSSQWNYCSANTNAASQNLAKKLQRRIFNHKNRIVVANSQVVDRSQNYRIYNVIGLLSSLWNVYHSTAAYFFDPPCIAYDEQQQQITMVLRVFRHEANVKLAETFEQHSQFVHRRKNCHPAHSTSQASRDDILHTRASAGFWLGGSMPPCRVRRRKIWKFGYKMVHSWAYLNKYVINIAPLCTSACPIVALKI